MSTLTDGVSSGVKSAEWGVVDPRRSMHELVSNTGGRLELYSELTSPAPQVACVRSGSFGSLQK